jgi:hypothetical protein
VNGKLPGVHERFPVRDLEVEVVDEGLLSVDISSKKRLELNIASSFIELAMTTMSILDWTERVTCASRVK